MTGPIDVDDASQLVPASRTRAPRLLLVVQVIAAAVLTVAVVSDATALGEVTGARESVTEPLARVGTATTVRPQPPPTAARPPSPPTSQAQPPTTVAPPPPEPRAPRYQASPLPPGVRVELQSCAWEAAAGGTLHASGLLFDGSGGLGDWLVTVTWTDDGVEIDDESDFVEVGPGGAVPWSLATSGIDPPTGALGCAVEAV